MWRSGLLLAVILVTLSLCDSELEVSLQDTTQEDPEADPADPPDASPEHADPIESNTEPEGAGALDEHPEAGIDTPQHTEATEYAKLLASKVKPAVRPPTSSADRMQPTTPESAHPNDVYSPHPSRGVDGGAHRKTGTFLNLWQERENLINILNTVKAMPRQQQAMKVYHDEYINTQKKLAALEAQLGVPYDKAAEAIHHMQAIAFARDGKNKGFDRKELAEEYVKAAEELKEAIAAGPADATGLFKSFKDNAGRSRDAAIDSYNRKVLLGASLQEKVEMRKQAQDDAAARIARHNYEVNDGPRPGCAYIDGPCDHLETDVPGAPMEIKANYITSRSVTLTWMEPEQNRAFVTGYRIMGKQAGDTEWKKMAEANGGFSHIMKKVRDLEPNTTYELRLQSLYVHASIRKMSISEISKQLQMKGEDSYDAAAQVIMTLL